MLWNCYLKIAVLSILYVLETIVNFTENTLKKDLITFVVWKSVYFKFYICDSSILLKAVYCGKSLLQDITVSLLKIKMLNKVFYLNMLFQFS